MISNKLWKLLSHYNLEERNDERSWTAFATHYLRDEKTGKPKTHWVKNRQGKLVETLVYQSTNLTSVSIESWHDDIHVLVGSGVDFEGHMAVPSHAGVSLANITESLHHC
jgi:hypothetical protein